ncbi:MAG: cysteine hydrolase [Oscillospiraceae bacterium]|nr:cysteine hydrolase [Oscillospiraceae bacterium]
MHTLIVIDMQNDFIDGALGTAEAVSIVPNVKKKVSEYLSSGGTVIYTRDTHTSEYLSTQEGKNLPVIHCVRGTEGWEIANGVYADGCKIVDKPSFGSTELPEVLAEIKDLKSIELVGLCTDICVISNAMILKAAFPEIPITVNSSCCAGVTPESHENALKAMAVCQIKIV